MFFLVSSVLSFFLAPSNIVALLGLVGLLALLLARFRLGIAALVGSTLLLALLGWSPVGSIALLALEDRFARPVIDRPVTGVILLGGGVDTHVSGDRGTFELNAAGERITATMALSRLYPQSRIFLSGGGKHLGQGQIVSESTVARDMLVSFGLDPARISMEEDSRDTFENATASLTALQPKTGELWLLVTSANHMPRAIGSFRKAGFDVTAYPVDYQTRGEGDLYRPMESIMRGLFMSDLAAHEWVGLATYWLTGRISEPFPGP